ncbi:MAG: hypothetical protein M3541_13705 [Acidobacteriota bacterium]|nr:hypothetical protein [Acidobacteriota bacterium]MDQ3419810.1 hypothetical protein [Acidobacteriota bacterium]
MSIKITGLDDVQRHLKELQHRAESLSGEREVPVVELLTSEFMLLNTDFESAGSMFTASGYKVESEADLAAIPDEPWDNFVSSRTRFGSWNEMLEAAAAEYFRRRLSGEA